MELNLTIPSISTRVLSEVETRPAKVEQWLSQLPLLNLTETGRKVLSTLTIYNRMALEPELRLEILELFRYTVNLLTLELQKHYLGLPLPLPDKNKTIAEQNRQFQFEMAFGYKWVVMDLAKLLDAPLQGREKEKLIQQLTIAVQRAIHYLTESLVISYESYSPYPLGVWREIHLLYHFAEHHGFADNQIDDQCNRSLERSSVSHAYKQVLLLDLADPYHLPARHIDKIYQYLDRWAMLAQVIPAAQSFDPTCQFLIDLTSEQAGIAYTADTVLQETDRYRLLNTVELARRVHTHLTQMQQGQLPDPEGLGADFFRDTDGLLRRLINAWGLHPRRSFRRNAKSETEIDVAIGIDAINYWINGGSRFVVSSTFVGPMPQRGQVGPNEKRSAEMRSPDMEYSRWNVLDESAGGMALAKKGHIKMRIRVGDLLGIREPDGAWSIAAARWARSASPSSIEIGTQRLAPGAEAVVIKTLNEKNEESDFLPALLLPEIKALKQPPTLVTACGIYRPDRTLYMDNGFRLYKVEADKALETTGAFERFSIRILNP
jgi:hypothetical protein